MKIKILSSILAVVLILSGTAFATEIGEEFVIAQNIIGKDGLNIADISDDDVVTRADMVDIIINLMQICEKHYYIRDPQEHVYYMPFFDWKLEEEKEKLIERLYESKVIKGYGDNTFRPNETCTFEEAITFVVRSLGWEVVTEYYGGYPQGYIKVAEKLGLIDENVNMVSKNFNQELYNIIFKSLFVFTLELDISKYPKDLYYQSSPCALEKYQGLNYTYAYAKKEENKLIMDEEVFSGNVYGDEEFKEGYVLCIYEKDEETEENCIVICVEISEELFELKANAPSMLPFPIQ